MFNLFYSDNLIPSLDAHSTADDETAFDLELLVKLVDSCVSEKLELEDLEMESEECKPPPMCQEFQTARLFLSHLGFILLDNLNVRRSITIRINDAVGFEFRVFEFQRITSLLNL